MVTEIIVKVEIDKEVERQMPCIECNGSGLNMEGKWCGCCWGTGFEPKWDARG